MTLETSQCDVDLDFLANDFAEARDALLLIAARNCAPCVRMKAVVVEARLLDPSVPKASIFLLSAGEEGRLQEILGKPVRIFPSLCYRDPLGDDHWLQGAADKSGAFDAVRIAAWVSRKRDGIHVAH